MSVSRETSSVRIGQLLSTRQTIDPRKHPDEVFDLLSIPAFDEGSPETVIGSQIGSAKLQVSPSDVLVSKIVPHIQRVWVVPPRGDRRQIASSEWIVLRSNVAVPDYLRYALLDSRFHAQFMATVDGLSGSLQRARPQAVKQIEIELPTIPRQRAIADYLDRETAQIDAFIAKNEELITLLTERRAAVIAGAVLRGLDAAAELQDTSVMWLGKVPSHWRVSRLSRWFEVTLGKMLDESKFAGTVGDVLPYVRASNIKTEQLDLSDVNSMPFTPAEQSKFSLRTGDLVVVEGGSIGVNAPVEHDMQGWGFQKTVNRVRAIHGDLTRFVGYQLDGIRQAGVLGMLTNVSTIQHLTAEKLERIVVAMPPVGEQEAIVRHIVRATSAMDHAIETAEEGVRLASERRAALISAAVTGKIDVRVAA